MKNSEATQDDGVGRAEIAPGAPGRSAAELGAVLAEARERFARCVETERQNRAEALEDLYFRAGDQWPESVRREREAAERPVITVNRMPQFIRQVTGEVRINRPSIRVRPVDETADPKIARVLTGLIRHIEQASQARIAYATAAENAATCGIGHFRVVTEYSRDDGFDQDVRIRRIASPFAVYWDPEAEALTREDAGFAFVVARLPLAEFRARYPRARSEGFAGADDGPSPWWDGESVTVAEYWRREPARRTLGLTADGRTLDVDGLGEAARAALGIVRARTVEGFAVRQYLVSGAEILEGPTPWAGRFIPIVPVVGEEVHVGERTVRHGLIRYAKDAQRLYNYWRSAAAEAVALAPKAPFIGTLKQFQGLERFWQNANRENIPYLPYNPDGQAPPPMRQGFGDVPVALVNEAGLAAEDMKATTGIYDAGLGARSNETSGRAILARQREGDVGTYAYIDNLALAIEHAGRILVDLIPRIYDGERVVRVLGEDERESFVRINQTVITPEGLRIVNDLSVGEYDVAVTTGPGFTTRREEAAQSMMAFVQANPQAAALVIDLIAKNMDWPGADEIAARIRRTLPADLREDGAPAAVDPAAALEAAKATAEVAKARAQVMKARAEAEGQAIENAEATLALALKTGALAAALRDAVAEALTAALGRAPAPHPASRRG